MEVNKPARGPTRGAKYEKTVERVCTAPGCPRNGEPFEGTAKAVYCSRRCNLAAWRARQKEKAAS